MKLHLLVFLLVLTAIACNNQPQTKKERSAAVVDSIKPALSHVNKDTIRVDSVPKNIQVDSVIHLSFAPDSFSVTVKGHLDKKGNPVICYLPVVKGRTLLASVTPENKKAAIRFSHLYFPDGKSDGPFGPTLKYKLKQEGVYKIYIGPNMMAGNPVSTDFKVNVKVE